MPDGNNHKSKEKKLPIIDYKKCWDDLKTRLFVGGTAGHNTTIEIGDVLDMMVEIERGVRIVIK